MYPKAISLPAEPSAAGGGRRKHAVSARPSPCAAAHLQDDGELLRGVAVLHAHGQPHLESRQLLRKEGTVLLEQEQE